MSRMLAVCERELRSSFRSPVAYAVLGLYLLLHGIFFAQLMEDYSSLSLRLLATGGEDPNLTIVDLVVRPLVQVDAFVLLLLLPALSMRQFADEWRSGTSDLLMSYPLSELQIVAGKYLASLLLLALLVVLGALYPLSALFLGHVEIPVLLAGQLGLFLYGASVLSIGLLFSALSENQVIAFAAALATLLGLLVLAWWGLRLDPPWGLILRQISPMGHLSLFSSGLLRLSSGVFLLSVVALAGYLTVGVLELRRGRGGS